MNARVDDWLRLAAERVHAQAGELTRLDQAIGDGDHGLNLDRGFGAVAAAIEALGEEVPDTADRLRLAGRTLIGSVGGASGPLYGTALLRAAGAIGSARAGHPMGELLTLALEAAAAGVAALGRSTTGEKTMLDALVPAAQAARAALDRDHDAAAVARAAAEAAEIRR